MKVHTPLPEHVGELVLANHLAKMCDDSVSGGDRIHAWYAISPGNIGEIDLLLWVESVGVFAIEVKAVSLSCIDRYTLNKWEHHCYQNVTRTEVAPHITIEQKQYSLGNWLASRTQDGEKPFITPVVCFTKIRRAKWNATWEPNTVVGEFADGIIFKEDLVYGLPHFVERLKHIRRYPARGKAALYPFKHDFAFLKDVNRLLTGEGSKTVLESDLEKLERIEGVEGQKSLRDAPLDRHTKVYYRGYPGTGKTYRLLQIGIGHALHGNRTLYLCYNKTLASDMRRIVRLSEDWRKITEKFVIYDIFQMLSAYQVHADIEMPTNTLEGSNSYDEWAELIVSDMRKNDDVVKYDTILIDEAQDIQTWAFDMATIHSHDETTLCVADGRGQELYGNRSPWLDCYEGEAKESGTAHQLKRVFRNSKQMFQLAQLVFNTQLDKSKIQTSLISMNKSRSRNKSVQQTGFFDDIEYILKLDQRQQLEYVDSEVVPWSPQSRRKKLVDEYARIIEIFAKRLGTKSMADLLIIVPTERSEHHRCVVDALDKLELTFLDYTVEKNRRINAVAEKVRICTFQSARGIESRYVILFGSETLWNIPHTLNVIHNLLYIALSRANLELTIAIDWREVEQTPKDRPNFVDFLETAFLEMDDVKGMTLKEQKNDWK